MAGEDKPETILTRWFDVDNPWEEDNPNYGKGDYETIDNIQLHHTICADDYQIVGAECRLVLGREDETFNDVYPMDTGDELYESCTKDVGLICRQEDQPDGQMCQDYAIRFTCGYRGGEKPYENLFPEFDARIYLILAIVPVLIFLVRLFWVFICRRRRRQQRRRRRELRRRLGQAREGEEDAAYDDDDDDNDSINSDLARPPPSYQELFKAGTPAVFTITSQNSGGACPKCRDANCSVVKGAKQGQKGGRQRGVSDPPPPPISSSPPSYEPPPSSSSSSSSLSSSSSSASSSSSSPRDSSSSESSNSTPFPNQSDTSSVEQRVGEDIALQNMGPVQDEPRTSVSLEDEVDGSRAQRSSSLTDSSLRPHALVALSVSNLSNTDSGISLEVPADAPCPCACACHRSGPSNDRGGVTAYDNAAFTSDHDLPSPSHGPVPYRGRHIPALPRPASGVSIITLTELPSYEDALVLEKKFAAQKTNI